MTKPFSRFLEEMELTLASFPDTPFQLYNFDQEICSSLMHKAIRRGDVEIAQRAAMTYLKKAGSDIWRRLMVIVLEDIGIGSFESAIMIVSAAQDPNWRKRVGGNERIVPFIVKLLAEAPKDRTADHLIRLSMQGPLLKEVRNSYKKRPLSEQLDAVADTSLPLPVRAIATWYASGVVPWYQRHQSFGDLNALMVAYEEMGIHKDLVLATQIAAKRTQEPITVMLPLIWHVFQEEKRGVVRKIQLPPAATYNDLPLYALDKHTDLGKEALKTFSMENQAVHSCLERYVPPSQWYKAVSLAVFYVESDLISQRFDWSQSKPIEAMGIENDLLWAGVKPDGIQAFLETVRHNSDGLNAIRLSLLYDTTGT